MQAQLSGYVVYRPHYHPVLDTPISDQLDSELEALENKLGGSRNTRPSSAGQAAAAANDKNGPRREMSMRELREMWSRVLDFSTDDGDSVVRERIGPDGRVESSSSDLDTDAAWQPRSAADSKDRNPPPKKTPAAPTAPRASQILLAPMKKRKAVIKFSGGPGGVAKASKVAGSSKPAAGAGGAGGGGGASHHGSKEKKKKAFSGGCVLEPVRGYHECASVLDFNSLYPTIMMAYRLDMALLVLDARDDNLPGIEYMTIRMNRRVAFRYVQNRPGPVITVTRELVDARKRTQARLAVAKQQQEACGLLLKTAAKRTAVPPSSNAGEFCSPAFYDRLLVWAALHQFAKRAAETTAETAETTAPATPFSYGKETIAAERVGEELEQRGSALLASCPYGPNGLLSPALSVELARLDAEVINLTSMQNEQKVSANATFGAQGGRRKHSKLSVIPVPACTTFLGRRSIERARDWTLETYRGSRCLYGDTDSIFIDWGVQVLLGGTASAVTNENVQRAFYRAFEVGEEAAAGISRLFPAPMKMAHEKVEAPLILYNPKCYAGYSFLQPNFAAGKIENKGLSFVKRDYCAFVRDLCTGAMDLILNRRDVDAAKRFVLRLLDELASDRYKPSDLDLYRKLGKKSYHKDKKVAHALLAQRINQRRPGLGPKTGEYVRFQVYDIGDADFKKKDLSQRIEEPEWIVANGKHVDILWYLKKQVENSVLLLFGPLMADPGDLLRPAIRKRERVQMRAGPEIGSFLSCRPRPSSSSSSVRPV